MAREELERLPLAAKLEAELRHARPPRPERRPQRHRRGARRRRRRGGIALRRRPVPHVRPLRRAPALEGRGHAASASPSRAASRRSSPRCAGRAYSRLKFESGVHRVQRVPTTEAQGRIHTSTATVSVLPEADEVEVQIDEKDLRVDVYRSSGPGGQSVNTTDSAVRITHLPTGWSSRSRTRRASTRTGRRPCPCCARACSRWSRSARPPSAARSGARRSAPASARRRSDLQLPRRPGHRPPHRPDRPQPAGPAGGGPRPGHRAAAGGRPGATARTSSGRR